MDVPGGTDLTYEVQSGDNGADFTVEESFDGVTVESAPRTISSQRQVVVFPLIGQSNASDIATFDGGTDYPAGRVFQWGRYNGNDNTVIPAARPMDHWSLIRTQPIWLQFAIDFIAANPDKDVLFVPGAQDGSGLVAGEWLKGSTLYTDIVARTNQVLLENPNHLLGGFLMHMGETNALLNPVAFEGLLDTFITDLRTDVTLAGNATPFVVGAWYRTFSTATPMC